ncbi:hypothetical protein FIA58_010180 [Flavobacterium jejuense]|uniref:DUF3299 domain-containing protein n=1 Tax=Flavobacterium jejuense TaxID=1544455 RepID=A0ABX0IQE9_9FLAO|nr:hypothetical protein [Flavobacterium jejuense]NHN26042.1 hypothetical protein [Flavobacterium jejuense]
MRNYIKFSIALLVLVSLFSFNKKEQNSTFKKDKEIILTDTLTWSLLGKIEYLKKPDKVYGEIMFPVINPKLKSLQSKEVTISGFIIPIDNKNYAVSKNVFAACFFCGKSGPETLMGIKFKGDLPKLKTDQFVTLKGKFRYNDNDVEDWIYHIENAVITAGN